MGDSGVDIFPPLPFIVKVFSLSSEIVQAFKVLRALIMILVSSASRTPLSVIFPSPRAESSNTLLVIDFEPGSSNERGSVILLIDGLILKVLLNTRLKRDRGTAIVFSSAYPRS